MSRENVGKKYVSASVWSRGSLNDQNSGKSVEVRSTSKTSDMVYKFGQKSNLNRRSGSRTDTSLGSSGISDLEGN